MKNRYLNLTKKKKALIITITIFVLAFLYINIAEYLIESDAYIKPAYEKEDIAYILSKENLSESDYKKLFYQTGLGKTAIDELLQSSTGADEILEFQYNLFNNTNIICEQIGIITSQESITDDKGNIKYGFNLAPYENGYILLTKATHSLGWRHGHAAIVTNKEKEETLEAVILGEDSQLQNINKWRIYPSFMMLKLKDASEDTLNEIARFAEKYMLDMTYGLTIGLTSSKNPNTAKISGTQCSHLVWYPFMQFGYDLDSDGSWLVTPKDIANSDLLEIVQIYGVDPSKIWP